MKAACEDNPDVWFTELPQGRPSAESKKRYIRDTKGAVSACYDCPAMIPCGELGMEPDNIMWGIWGGMLPAERMTKAGLTKKDFKWGSPGYNAFKLLELVYA